MSSVPTILDTLPALDKLFGSIPTASITRPRSDQVNDVIDIDSATQEIPDFISADIDDVVLHCRFVGVLPFKLPDDEASRCSTRISPRSLDHAAAMALAVQHLNTGDSSIVSSLGNLRRQCSNLVFTIEYIDTKDNPGVAIEDIFGVIDRKQSEFGYRMPCTFVGGVRSAVTIPTALLTGHKGYMEVSGSSTAFELDDRVQYPHFARTIPSEQDNVIPIVTYFADVLQLKYLAVIHVNEPYGNSFAESLARETDRRNVAPHIRRISIDSTGDTLISALNELKASQYSYILAAMPNTRFYDRLLREAFTMELAGNENYQWYFSDSFSYRQANLTSYPLRMAYNRTGMFMPSAGKLHNNSNFNEFASELRDLTKSVDDIEYVKQMISSCPPKSQNANSTLSADTVSSLPPSDRTAFMYDAAIAAGITACYGASFAGLNGTQGFSAVTQFDILTKMTPFNATTGEVDFDNSTGSRTYTSAFYELKNFLVEENTTDLVETVTDIYHRGEWSDGEADFVFSNGMGMDDPPNVLQPTTIQGNLTPTYMKGLALFFSSFSMLIAIGFAIWTWRNRKTRVIMASQPFFLYLILLGVILVAASIIPYSFDDQTFSQSVCNHACTAIPWLLFPGLSVIFSALFTKTYRINLM